MARKKGKEALAFSESARQGNKLERWTVLGTAKYLGGTGVLARQRRREDGTEMGMPRLRRPFLWGTSFQAALFVHAVWAILFVSCLFFIRENGFNVPYDDDWAIVPYMTGTYPVTMDYLWEQHNEHRLVLPKLLLLGIARLTHGNFRAGMCLNVAGLALLALMLMWAARRLRGRTSFADAFFPMALLHWGHCENILWSWQIQFIASTMLLGILFMLVVLRGGNFTFLQAGLFGICLILLAICGSQGLPFVFALSGWLAFVALRKLYQAPDGNRRAGVYCLLLAIVGVATVGAYFIGYQGYKGSFSAMPYPPIRAVLTTALEIIGMAIGLVNLHFGSLGSWGVVAMFALSNLILLIGLLRHRPDKNRLVGVLAINAAQIVLVALIAKSRTGDPTVGGNFGTEYRYVTLMAPVLFVSFFAWMLCGGHVLGRLAPMAFFTVVTFVGMANDLEGQQFADKGRAPYMRNMMRDMAQGKPLYHLARQYTRSLGYEIDQKGFSERLQMLRDARIGPFRYLGTNPPFREIPIDLDPAETFGVRPQGRGWNVVHEGSYLVFDVPEPRFVAGVRVKIRYANPKGSTRFRDDWQTKFSDYLGPHHEKYWQRRDAEDIFPRFRIRWKAPEQTDFFDAPWEDNTAATWSEARNLPPSLEEQTVEVWTDNRIDRIRIAPDDPLRIATATNRFPPNDPGHRPCAFTISEITLLVPRDREMDAGSQKWKSIKPRETSRKPTLPPRKP